MKRLATVLAAVIAALAVVGCAANPATPAALVTPAAVVTATQHAAAAKHPAPLLGVDVYSEADYSVSATESYGSAVLPYIRKTLDAQVVGLIWDLCSPGKRSNVVAACKPDRGTASMSPTDISDLAEMARKDGLQVQMRPIIRVGPTKNWDSPPLSWEGHLVPTSDEKFFKNLLKAEQPYLSVARSVGVTQFVVATELYSLPYSKWWPWFLTRAASDCHCSISYAAQYTQYFDNSKNLPHVYQLGTDAYPALNLPSNASQASVTKGWEKSLAKVPESKRERTSLDETSIRATEGAYKDPSSWDIAGKADPTVQVRYFTAACETAKHYNMHAIYFYFIPLNDDPAHPVNYPAYFVGNAGSKAIAGCRKILA
jgi:hypothetical protein